MIPPSKVFLQRQIRANNCVSSEPIITTPDCLQKSEQKKERILQPNCTSTPETTSVTHPNNYGGELYSTTADNHDTKGEQI